jgi:hypothetical protein
LYSKVNKVILEYFLHKSLQATIIPTWLIKDLVFAAQSKYHMTEN